MLESPALSDWSLLHQVHSNGACLDDEILADPEVQDAIKNEGKVHRKFDIVNTDRATLGRIGGAIAKLHGDSGFAGQVSIDFEVRRCFNHMLCQHTSICCISKYGGLRKVSRARSSNTALKLSLNFDLHGVFICTVELGVACLRISLMHHHAVGTHGM